MADDPDFLTLQQQYGGGVATTTGPDKDPLFDFPKEWQQVYVILQRPDPVVTQAPGAMGRRIGGEPGFDTGPTLTGGGGQQITLTDLLHDYYRLPAAALAQYQQSLWLGGFYSGKARPAFGVPDERGFNAFKTAALRAAKTKKTLAEILTDAITSREEQNDPAAGRPPLAIQLTNAADIEHVARVAAQEILGQDPDPGQVANIVRRFQAAQSSAQTQAYNTNYAGGTATQAPDLGVFAREEIENADPTGATAYAGASQVMNDFLSIIGGSVGG